MLSDIAITVLLYCNYGAIMLQLCYKTGEQLPAGQSGGDTNILGERRKVGELAE